MNDFKFLERELSLSIPVEITDIIDLSKYEILKKEGFHFVKELKVFIIDLNTGSKIINFLSTENKDVQAIKQSILSRIEKINWKIDIAKTNYLIKKEDKEVVVRFVTIPGAMQLYDHINAICKSVIFESFPPFHISIMTRGEIDEQDLPIINSTEEILELRPQRILI